MHLCSEFLFPTAVSACWTAESVWSLLLSFITYFGLKFSLSDVRTSNKKTNPCLFFSACFPETPSTFFHYKVGSVFSLHPLHLDDMHFLEERNRWFLIFNPIYSSIIVGLVNFGGVRFSLFFLFLKLLCWSLYTLEFIHLCCLRYFFNSCILSIEVFAILYRIFMWKIEVHNSETISSVQELRVISADPILFSEYNTNCENYHSYFLLLYKYCAN